MIEIFKKIWKEFSFREQPTDFQTYAGIDGPVVVIGGDPVATIIVESKKESSDPNLK